MKFNNVIVRLGGKHICASAPVTPICIWTYPESILELGYESRDIETEWDPDRVNVIKEEADGSGSIAHISSELMREMGHDTFKANVVVHKGTYSDLVCTEIYLLDVYVDPNPNTYVVISQLELENAKMNPSYLSDRIKNVAASREKRRQ